MGKFCIFYQSKNCMLKKVLILYFIALSFCPCVAAQGGIWTHMHGSIGSGALGLYGTKGVANATNTPSGRYEGAYWVDLSGNFWLFGGFAPQGYGNDLWKYDPVTKQWTWVNGPQGVSDPDGEYGVLGVPSPLNYPCARTFGPNCWTDLNGDLWLFGGYGYDYFGVKGGLCDLWKYHIATNEWTCIAGSNAINLPPVYGTQGIPAPGNTPGARTMCKAGWVDDNNNLWLFGGQDGTNAAVINVRNDMWKYNIASNMWTWMKGSNTLNSNGSYGTKGVELPTNNPPARMSYTKWKGKDKNFYVFAGGNAGASRNDVWRYNPFTNNWTWISGTQVQNNQGTYAGTCLPDSTTYPAARFGHQTVHNPMTCTEIFWTFGGFKTAANTETYNDLWVYNLTTNNWTWVSGSSLTNINPNPGPIGVPQPGRYIGSKGGVAIWQDALYNIWVFGGLAFDSTLLPAPGALGLKNDLWRFEPDTTCFDASFVTVLNLQYPNDTTFCVGDSCSMVPPKHADLVITPATDFHYNADSSLIIFNPQTTTTYTVTGSEQGLCAGKDTIVFTISVIPYPLADFTLSPLTSLTTEPLITLTNTSTQAASYEWYFNGQVFSNNPDATYNGNDSGQYCFTLVAYNSLGCADTVTHCAEKLLPDQIFVPSVFSPNHDLKNDEFRILSANITLKSFVVYDRWGEQVFTTKDPAKGWDGRYKGKDCDIGTYYYYIEYDSFKGKKTLKGEINLVR